MDIEIWILYNFHVKGNIFEIFFQPLKHVKITQILEKAGFGLQAVLFHKSIARGYDVKVQNRAVWVQIVGLPLTSSVTSGNLTSSL